MRTVSEKVEKLLAALREEVAAVDEFNRLAQAEIVRLQNQIVDRCAKAAITAQILRDVEKRVGAEVAEEPVAEAAVVEEELVEEEFVEEPIEAAPAFQPTAKDRILTILNDADRPWTGREFIAELSFLNERTVWSALSQLKAAHKIVHDPQAMTYSRNPTS